MTRQKQLLEGWTRLLQVQHSSIRLLEAALVQHGLDLPTYEILYRLSRAPQGRMRMQTLAAALLLSPSGLSRAVAKGELRGLLARTSDKADERGRICSLTSEGLSLLQELQPRFLAALSRIFDPLTTAEVVSLTETLRKLQ